MGSYNTTLPFKTNISQWFKMLWGEWNIPFNDWWTMVPNCIWWTSMQSKYSNFLCYLANPHFFPSWFLFAVLQLDAWHIYHRPLSPVLFQLLLCLIPRIILRSPACTLLLNHILDSINIPAGFFLFLYFSFGDYFQGLRIGNSHTCTTMP